MKDILKACAVAAVLFVTAMPAYATDEGREREDRERDRHERDRRERDRDGRDRDGRGHSHGIACSVSAVNLAFGNYNPLRGDPADTTGNIAVMCSGKPGERVAYGITLNAGGSGTFAQRRMRFGSSSTLNYNIYTGAARSLVWGDGSAGTLTVSDSFSLHSPRTTRNYPVYGRISGGQNKVRVGVYTDSIVVTLDF